MTDIHLPDPGLINSLREILGTDGIREHEDDLTPTTVLKPATTEQVSAVLRCCHAAGQSLIPIGGRSGLVGGLLRTGSELGLSLERMAAVEEIDQQNRTMTVEAGCILQVAAEAAQDAGLLLPLDLGARGSATVGGNVATNAGGNRVIRYGMMRDMVLGLEVVLADGTVLTALNKVLKNNTGYDLKQWFIGAEGTLGVITRVVLRLRPLPRSQNTALVALDSFAAVTRLLHHMDAASAGTLSAFEVMWPDFYEAVTASGGNHRAPLPCGSAFYVLLETLGGNPQADATQFADALGEALQEGTVQDAVIARSQAERNEIWEIRDDVFAIWALGPLVTFDVSVTLQHMEALVAEAQAVVADYAQPIVVTFGHIGDGNLHLMLGSRDPDEFDKARIEAGVYAVVARYSGSISAEHGIGLDKRGYLHHSRSADEIALMQRMKLALDPHNILNPGKIVAFPATDAV